MGPKTMRTGRRRGEARRTLTPHARGASEDHITNAPTKCGRIFKTDMEDLASTPDPTLTPGVAAGGIEDNP